MSILIIQYQIMILVMSIGVVVLDVIERVVIPDPGHDHHTPVPFCSRLKEFCDPWRDLLVKSGGPGTRGGSKDQVVVLDGGGEACEALK